MRFEPLTSSLWSMSSTTASQLFDELNAVIHCIVITKTWNQFDSHILSEWRKRSGTVASLSGPPKPTPSAIAVHRVATSTTTRPRSRRSPTSSLQSHRHRRRRDTIFFDPVKFSRSGKCRSLERIRSCSFFFVSNNFFVWIVVRLHHYKVKVSYWRNFCGTVVEHKPLKPDIAGLESAECWAFFIHFYPFKILSLCRCLKKVQHHLCSG